MSRIYNQETFEKLPEAQRQAQIAKATKSILDYAQARKIQYGDNYIAILLAGTNCSFVLARHSSPILLEEKLKDFFQKEVAIIGTVEEIVGHEVKLEKDHKTKPLRIP